MPTPPRSFCLRCRSLLDAEQACDCGSAKAHLALGPGAERIIEEALLVAPDLDVVDSTQRMALSLVLGPGAVALVFALAAPILAILVGGLETTAWILGVPFVLVTLAWVALFVSSEIEARRPFYRGARSTRRSGEAVVSAVLEAGAIEVLELRQDTDAPVVVRDAIATEELVLRAPGQRIAVPAGRLRVELPEGRLRLAPPTASLARTWAELPARLRAAGRLRGARIGEGVRVELLDGELEDLARHEASFREAAEERRRFKPRGGRVRLRVVD